MHDGTTGTTGTTRRGRRHPGPRFAAAGALLGMLGWLAWTQHLSERVDLWLHGEQPIQFYLTLDGDLLDDYSRVFGVAHNSGDRLATTREALDHGADVIEIDVISISGVLFAAHTTPPRFVTRHVYRGPPLELVWAQAVEADVIALDLKETSPRYVELVIAFLAAHPDQQVIVSTRDRATFEALRERAPAAYRFLSIGSRAQLDALYADLGLATLVDGASIRETLVDAQSAAWMDERGLMILAWTVNDLKRMNELVALGVDGITTDNLAIMELLGGQERDETLLGRAARHRTVDT